MDVESGGNCSKEDDVGWEIIIHRVEGRNYFTSTHPNAFTNTKSIAKLQLEHNRLRGKGDVNETGISRLVKAVYSKKDTRAGGRSAVS